MTDINKTTNPANEVKVSSPLATEAMLKLGKLLRHDNVSTVEILNKNDVDALAQAAGVQSQSDFSLDKEKLQVLRGSMPSAYTQAKKNK